MATAEEDKWDGHEVLPPPCPQDVLRCSPASSSAASSLLKLLRICIAGRMMYRGPRHRIYVWLGAHGTVRSRQDTPLATWPKWLSAEQTSSGMRGGGSEETVTGRVTNVRRCRAPGQFSTLVAGGVGPGERRVKCPLETAAQRQYSTAGYIVESQRIYIRANDLTVQVTTAAL